MPELRFENRLESDRDACFIRVPPEVVAALGRGNRAPVKVTLNNHTYRTTIAVYGGQHYLGVRREVREAAGIAAGDHLIVALEYDAELRTVDLPEGLRLALEADTEAATAFDRLSYTNKKELAQWVAGAKRAETQRRRMEQAMARLRPRTAGR
jgi:Domain of unknown function (DUF1905)/Bacteriocin-protection, YdeI or OmpD-Associated